GIGGALPARRDRAARIDAASRQIHKGRRRIEREQRVVRIVVTVREVVRQRDLSLEDRIAQLQREVFAELEAEPRAKAERLGVVRNVAVGELLALIQVESERDAVIQQIRFDERQRVAARILAVGDRGLGEQTASEEIALGDADLGERAVGGRIAARNRE